MPIPTFQDVMTPFLRALASGAPKHVGELSEEITNGFNLTPEERDRMLPSGQMTYVRNRIGWARTYLYKTKLIEQAGTRGVYRITPRGLEVLKKYPDRVDNVVLRQFPEFQEWLQKKKSDEPGGIADIISSDPDKTPEELLDDAYRTLRADLSSEILEKVKSCSPAFFERLVVELLVKMGYGGSRQDAGQAIGRSGDGGIDGIIKEDRLGLDVIYLQAKRWENTVGRPEIQKFAGALQGRRAKKGVFITTSDYSRDARDFAANIESKIILIDGDQLADLMIDNAVGVSVVASYELKRIDSDYFVEE
jgi:restriction system protein